MLLKVTKGVKSQWILRGSWILAVTEADDIVVGCRYVGNGLKPMLVLEKDLGVVLLFVRSDTCFH
jgi:hypothetical protein